MRRIAGLLLLLIPLSISGLTITEQELTELEKILTEQEKTISELKEQLMTAKTQLTNSSAKIEALEISFKEYETEAESLVTDLRKRVAQKEREIHGLQIGLGISLGVAAVEGGVILALSLSR